MKTLELALKPKYLFGIPLALLLVFALAGCDDTPRQHAQVTQVQSQPSCGRFYDQEEQGMVTQCFDPGNRSCFTLYEPDGDQEYYCNGEKIWEIEPGDDWNGSWAFLAGMALADFSRPKYVSNKTKAKQKRPATYTRPTYNTPKSKVNQMATAANAQRTTPTPSATTSTSKPKSNVNQLAAAANAQRTTPTPSATTATSKPKVDLTKPSTKPKVDLSKPTTSTQPTVNLTKPSTKPKVDLSKPKTKAKKKVCKKVNGKTKCTYK